MIYFILFYLLHIFIYFLNEFIKNEKIKSLFLIFSMILSIIFAALRLTDPDRESYIAIYLGKQHVPEIGFNFFMNIFKAKDISYYYFFAFINSISLIMLYYNIKKLSKDKMFSILIYISYLYLIKDFIELRNAISISIILFSIKYLNKKSYKFFIVVFLSYLFHVSMIIWLPVFFFANCEFKRKKLFLILLFSFIFGKYVLQQNVFFYMIDFLKNNELISYYKYKKIVYHILYIYNSTFSFRTYYYIFLTIILIIFKDKFKYNKFYNIYLNVLIYALSIKLLFCNYSTISNRLYENLYVVSIFIIPLFIEKIKQKKFFKFIFIVYNFGLYLLFVYGTLNYYDTFFKFK